MNIQKISTFVASAAILVSVASPMAYAADNEISGNGFDSTNKIIESSSNSTVVSQSNSSNVVNAVSSEASTGGNKANANTGGDVSIDTGNAKNNTTVKTVTGGNFADIATCCGCNAGGSDLISGNGAKSYNKIEVTSVNSLVAVQSNDSDVVNAVSSKAKTGKNKANKNTDGSVGITTGNAKNTTKVRVHTGDNFLTTSPGCCQEQNCCNQPE
ncbi:MAG: hypothetical protein Q8Q49_06245 [bacterium]|nr:hypothetical protein [bacterium]